MTAGQKFIKLFEEMAVLCKEQGWGDPHSYARGKEIYATRVLGHTLPGANAYAGADGINESGEEVEYKSTTNPKVKGAYTGISVQETWEQQIKHLQEEKILVYSEHYYNRFKDGKLVESWMLTGKMVYDLLLPKIKRSYESRHNRKDPRVAAGISNTEIKTYGRRVI
jgi:hypothetical protein